MFGCPLYCTIYLRFDLPPSNPIQIYVSRNNCPLNIPFSYKSFFVIADRQMVSVPHQVVLLRIGRECKVGVICVSFLSGGNGANARRWDSDKPVTFFTFATI